MADQQGVYDLPPGVRVRVYHLPPDHISNKIPNMTGEEFEAYFTRRFTEAELKEHVASFENLKERWAARDKMREEEKQQKELESKNRKEKKSSKKKSKKKQKTDKKTTCQEGSNNRVTVSRTVQSSVRQQNQTELNRTGGSKEKNRTIEEQNHIVSIEPNRTVLSGSVNCL